MLAQGRIAIDPRPEDSALGASAIDLRLSPDFKVFRDDVLELELGAVSEDAMEAITVASGECFRLKRSEEHTSELQSLMRISYAVFCLKKKTNKRRIHKHER